MGPPSAARRSVLLSDLPSSLASRDLAPASAAPPPTVATTSARRPAPRGSRIPSVVTGTARRPAPGRPRTRSAVTLPCSALPSTKPSIPASGLNQAKSRGAGICPHAIAGCGQLGDLSRLLVGQEGLDLLLLPLPPGGELFPALTPVRPLATDLADLLHLLFGQAELLHGRFCDVAPAGVCGTALCKCSHGKYQQSDANSNCLFRVIHGVSLVSWLFVRSGAGPFGRCLRVHLSD